MLEVARNKKNSVNNGIHWRKVKRRSCDREISFKKLVVFDNNMYVMCNVCVDNSMVILKKEKCIIRVACIYSTKKISDVIAPSFARCST